MKKQELLSKYLFVHQKENWVINLFNSGKITYFLEVADEKELKGFIKPYIRSTRERISTVTLPRYDSTQMIWSFAHKFLQYRMIYSVHLSQNGTLEIIGKDADRFIFSMKFCPDNLANSYFDHDKKHFLPVHLQECIRLLYLFSDSPDTTLGYFHIQYSKLSKAALSNRNKLSPYDYRKYW